MRIPKFGTKNALYGYFWARIVKKLLSYLKSTPQVCLFAKFNEKTIIPKFGAEDV